MKNEESEITFTVGAGLKYVGKPALGYPVWPYRLELKLLPAEAVDLLEHLLTMWKQNRDDEVITARFYGDLEGV